MTQVTTTAEELKGRTGSVKLNKEEREQCARLGLEPSEFVRKKLRGELNGQSVVNSSLPVTVNTPAPPPPTDTLALVAQNSELRTENTFLKERIVDLKEQNKDGLSGMEVINAKVEAIEKDRKLDALEKETEELKTKLQNADNELSGVRSGERAQQLVDSWADTFIKVAPGAGEKLVERLLDRVEKAEKKEQAKALPEEDAVALELGNTLINAFSEDEWETVQKIIAEMMLNKDLIEEMKAFILAKKAMVESTVEEVEVEVN